LSFDLKTERVLGLCCTYSCTVMASAWSFNAYIHVWHEFECRM